MRPEPAVDREPTGLARTLRRQMPVLDGLRGLAILMVLAHRFNLDEQPVGVVARAVSAAMEAGWMGVQLFFVLSGFLITGILVDSREAPGYFRAFYARRALRIFPLYYLVLICAFVAWPFATGRLLDGHQHQLWLWVYLSNWAAPFGLAVTAFPHFWSLAVEEQFYLVWPWVVRALSPRGLARVCLGLLALGLASRAALRALGASPELPYQLTVCRADALALGALAALGLRTPSVVEALLAHRRALVAGTLALTALTAVATHRFPRTGALTQTLGYPVLALAFVVLVVLAVAAEARAERLARLLSLRPLRALGKYSYAMYVFHVPLHHQVGVPLLARLAPGPRHLAISLTYFAAMTALTLVCAVGSYHLVEKHFLRWKNRYQPWLPRKLEA